LTEPCDFTVSANPTSTDITGTPSNFRWGMTTIAVNSAIATTISFSASPPSGMQTNFNPASVTVASGGTATSSLGFTLSSGSTLTAGTYTVPVTATGSGLSHMINVPVFYSGDYSISVSTFQVIVTVGSNNAVGVYLNSLNGFSGSVTFSGSAMPSGVSYSYNPQTLTAVPGALPASSLSISATSTATQGSFTFTITGYYLTPDMQVGIQHQMQITVSVASSGGGGGGGGGGPPRPM